MCKSMLLVNRGIVYPLCREVRRKSRSSTVLRTSTSARSSTSSDMDDHTMDYRRETVRQLPTWRGLSPPVHSPSPSGYTYAYVRQPYKSCMDLYGQVHTGLVHTSPVWTCPVWTSPYRTVNCPQNGHKPSWTEAS